MRITEIEIHEFDYRLDDVGRRGAREVYVPGETSTRAGFILTIRTADGQEGYYRGFGFAPPTVAQVEMAAEHVIGRDPLEREGIWQDLWVALRHTDHMGLSPIDVALWDLAGRHYQESISTLLGGYRDRIPAYASTYFGDDTEGGLNTPEAYAEFARACLEEGYPGFKIHPYGEPDRDIEICRAVAEEVGDEMDLMLDPASAYRTYTETLRVGRVLDELDFYWYEDPMADGGESINMAKRLAADLETPILGCEHVRGSHYSRADHLTNASLDLVRGDVHQDGGITGAMKIGAATEAFGLDVEFHHAGPAHLHCISAMRNVNYVEHGMLHPEVGWVIEQGFTEEVEQLNDDGTMSVPTDPGLGVEIDWELIEDRQTDHTVIT